MIKQAGFTGLLMLFILVIFSHASGSIIVPAPDDESGIAVVVIDPGHGGRDPGATFGRAKEKDIVLDIARKLGDYITMEFPGVKVIYTRNKDVFVPLYQRAGIANKNKADLFISIHVNSVIRGLVQGTETYVLGQHRSRENLEVAKKENSVILLENDYTTTYEGFDPNSPESYIMFELVQDEYLDQSVMLASAIQNQFRERAKRIDRSVKQAGFLVLRRTAMPSVLIETGFLSHPSERSFLMSETGRDYLASAIFRAFREYKKNIEGKSNFQMATGEVTSDTREAAPLPEIKKIQETETETINTGSNNDIYFSIQIAALQHPLSPKPENFKNEKNIFERKEGKIYRYFSGRFISQEQAGKEKVRLQAKFNGAFVVAFRNNKRISVKKALRKM